MDITAEVSSQLSFIDVFLSDFGKTCPSSKKDKSPLDENEDALPDSTTSNIEKDTGHSFQCGDDVLVPNKDGRYYLGTVVEVNIGEDGEPGCLIKFGDGTHSWACSGSLKPLRGESGQVMCVVCKLQDSSNTLITCDMCGRGYHVECHTPTPLNPLQNLAWHCRRCVNQRDKCENTEGRAIKRASSRKQLGFSNYDTASSTSSTTSEVLQPSDSHCYCGKGTDRLIEMLMCSRCTRWFHQRCITSLQYPLYAGDKLYIFACADCNGGSEYLRRLELRWLDVAHLALYSLTAYSSRIFFDLDTVIMPYLMDNWHALQLPEKMSLLSPAERREHVHNAFSSCRARFRSGRESKKRANLWALRHRRPPPPHPKLQRLTQTDEILTDDLVRRIEPKLKFLPRQGSENQSKRMIVPADNKWVNLMTGKRFPQLKSDVDTMTSSPPHELTKTLSMVNYDIDDDTNKTGKNICEDFEPTSTQKKQKQMVKLFALDYQNGSFVKKSIPFGDTVEKPSKSKKRKISTDNNIKEKLSTKDESSSISDFDKDKSQRDCSSSPDPEIIIRDSSLDRLFEYSSKCQKNELNKLSDINGSSSTSSLQDTEKSNEASVCESTYSHKIATMNLEISKLSTTNIIEHSKIMSLKHMNSYHPSEMESSGDETSSRGTLDVIIPPLKDFQGKNNPFLMQNARAKSKARLSLPAIPVSRPLKRQLSEKDLIIGPNGEVKRRRFRRPRKASKVAQNLRDKSLPNPVQHARCLRQRPEKNVEQINRRNTVSAVESLKLSPHKNGKSPEPLSKLQSSVKCYFGAATRARAGEKFHLSARRTNCDGRTQYLVLWDNN